MDAQQKVEGQANKEDKKGILGKLQDITPDKDEQVALIGVAVRLGIVCWSGFILTLAYVDLPGFQRQNFDPTFIASVFTGALSTFGLATAKDKKNGNGVTKEDMEDISKYSQSWYNYYNVAAMYENSIFSRDTCTLLYFKY